MATQKRRRPEASGGTRRGRRDMEGVSTGDVRGTRAKNFDMIDDDLCIVPLAGT